MPTKTEKVKVQMWCRWCEYEWWMFIGREEAEKMAENEPCVDCPRCKQPT